MTLRRRAREAAPDPDRWYPACWSHDLERESVRQVVFWGRSIAVFRDADGTPHALRDRCAHRPVPLSMGEVRGCELVCPYHGWSFSGDGSLVDIPHSLFGKKKPRLHVPSRPIVERYGLVWLWPGDPSKVVPLLTIPPLDEGWSSIGIDAVWKAHHSAVIDNLLDLTHDHLHRRFRPFVAPELLELRVSDERVEARYRTEVASAAYLKAFLPVGVDMSAMTMRYIYPHHCSNTGDVVRHWTLVRPIDAQTTHVFVIFTAKAARIPGTRTTIPSMLMRGALRALRRLYIEPLLEQDRVVLEAEQRLHDEDPDAAAPELNPVVRAVHQLAVRHSPANASRVAGSASASSTSVRCASSSLEKAATRRARS